MGAYHVARRDTKIQWGQTRHAYHGATEVEADTVAGRKRGIWIRVGPRARRWADSPRNSTRSAPGQPEGASTGNWICPRYRATGTNRGNATTPSQPARGLLDCKPANRQRSQSPQAVHRRAPRAQCVAACKGKGAPPRAPLATNQGHAGSPHKPRLSLDQTAHSPADRDLSPDLRRPGPGLADNYIHCSRALPLDRRQPAKLLRRSPGH